MIWSHLWKKSLFIIRMTFELLWDNYYCKLKQKHMTLKRVALFLETKLGILGHQFYAQISGLGTKIRFTLHARENARATLHRTEEI